jgi:hypothetical protein
LLGCSEQTEMTAKSGAAKLLADGNSMMKRDVRGAIELFQGALAFATTADDAVHAAEAATLLAHAWGRRKSWAKSVYYARRCVAIAPRAKSSWTTLAKVCELIAARTDDPRKRLRGALLFRLAAKAFREAAARCRDAEDKRWLLELASGAASNGAASTSA